MGPCLMSLASLGVPEACVTEENIIADADKCQGPVFDGPLSLIREENTWKGTRLAARVACSMSSCLDITEAQVVKENIRTDDDVKQGPYLASSSQRV